jgi:hypothetical protein
VTLETAIIPVVVSGEVQKPGKISFERPATVCLKRLWKPADLPRMQIRVEGDAYAINVRQPRRRDLRSSKVHQFLTKQK